MDDTTQARVSWFHVTPDRFVMALLAAELLLWLSERFGWLPWHKGYAVLTAVAVVGVAMLLMLVWFAVATVFRRRFQFSVRSLLVLVVVVAMPCSWIAVEIRATKKEREAIEAVRKAENWVFYDFEMDASEKKMANPEPPQPAWLRRLLGDEFFCDVVEVHATTNAAIKNVESFPELRTLFTYSPASGDNPAEVTDVALDRIGACSHLETLHLRHTSITDEGLRHLAGLTNLKHLDVQDTKITDAGLENLQALSRLEILDIRSNDIADMGLKHLEGLRSLKLLTLFGTKVTDEGVRKIQEAMPKCEVNCTSFSFLM
ncbi:MAG: leucine-rich repeat domain-containing protein [Thermoguttaceae bacterium]